MKNKQHHPIPSWGSLSLSLCSIQRNPSSLRLSSSHTHCANLSLFPLSSIFQLGFRYPAHSYNSADLGQIWFSLFASMYRDRGGVGSSKGGEMLDRKRINDALDKHLEKSSPSTSRNKGSAVAVPSTSAAVGKHIDPRNNRSSSTLTTDKNKCSDGSFFLDFFLLYFFFSQ